MNDWSEAVIPGGLSPATAGGAPSLGAPSLGTASLGAAALASPAFGASTLGPTVLTGPNVMDADAFGGSAVPATTPHLLRDLPAGMPAHTGLTIPDTRHPTTPVDYHRPSAWDRFAEELITWFKTLASAAVYATLIVTFVCQVARVEGQSMAPTLEDQDRLIVNKFAYRMGDPHKGDIVMLYYPVNPDKSFVKRIIAEPEDEVHIVDGRVYVNGVPIKDDYVPPQFRSHDDLGPINVKPGYYFVMGDHRNNSSDSRHWGEVPKKYIIGKVQLRWWPLPTARIFE